MDLKEFFEKELGVKESFKVPEALMKKLLDKDQRTVLFDAYFAAGLEVNSKTFNDYFESGHGDRKNFMQDFTPTSITDVIKGLAGKQTNVLDICAGVGALSRDIECDNLVCEELSERALPILLFTIAIENKSGLVRNKNVLYGETFKTYKLTKGEKYSDIEIIEEREDDTKYDLIISNPPYSLKWDPKDVKDINQYGWYELAPKSKADYAFITGQLNRLADHGRMIYVFPQGVLFRGSAEGKIREKLLEENLIDMLIGMPGNMFTNTAIPTVIMVLEKNRDRKDVLMINAAETCEKVGKFNVFTDENLTKILTVAKHRMQSERFSDTADFEKIEKNDFNLNLPRYVDITIPEPVPGLLETMKQLFAIDEELEATRTEFFTYFFELVGSTLQMDKEVKECQRMIEEKYGKPEPKALKEGATN